MVKVAELNERLRTLDTKFAASIESLVNIYPQYKMNPNFSTYSKVYNADMGTIDEIHQDYASMRQRISTELETMQKKLKNVNLAISRTSQAKTDMDNRRKSLVGAEESATGQSAFFDSRYRGKVWTIAGLIAGSAFILYRSVSK